MVDLKNVVIRIVVASQNVSVIDPPITRSDIVEFIGKVYRERWGKIVDEVTLIDVDVSEITFGVVGGLNNSLRDLVERVELILGDQDFYK